MSLKRLSTAGRRRIRRLAKSVQRRRKIFCLAMQRTGTTSFGDFCENELGLERRGWGDALRNNWTEKWYEGRYEEIFRSIDFRSGEVFEDAPWFCLDLLPVLFRRFRDAQFVLIKRPPDDWFRSMFSHSGGASLGNTRIHAYRYGRESEVGAGTPRYNGLQLIGCQELYKASYARHTEDVIQYFEMHDRSRLLVVELDDPSKFRRVAKFLGYPDIEYKEYHSNRTRAWTNESDVLDLDEGVSGASSLVGRR
jgi:hypothetical protein